MIARIVAVMLAMLAVVPPARAADTGRFVEIAAVPSVNIAPPHVVVWLPPGYDAGTRRYGVVYMHDGQNLFFAERSNFKKVWAADASAMRLIAAGKVAPFIIVGIDQPGVARYRQYFPQVMAARASPPLKAQIEASGPLTGDAYLRFLTDELKPLIDRDYRTRRDPGHTAIVGSSMGGLISCYALMRAPQVFGRAGCISTHVPLGDPEKMAPYHAEIEAIWQATIAGDLGSPRGRRLWMDHGTETLDAYYAPYQTVIDAALVKAGWRDGADFASRVYPGAAHEENAWAARLDDIFGWLLAGW